MINFNTLRQLRVLDCKMETMEDRILKTMHEADVSMMENERLLSDYKRALSHQYDVNSRIAQRLKEEVSDIKAGPFDEGSCKVDKISSRECKCLLRKLESSNEKVECLLSENRTLRARLNEVFEVNESLLRKIAYLERKCEVLPHHGPEEGTVYFEMEKKIIKLECQIEKLKVKLARKTARLVSMEEETELTQDTQLRLARSCQKLEKVKLKYSQVKSQFIDQSLRCENEIGSLESQLATQERSYHKKVEELVQLLSSSLDGLLLAVNVQPYQDFNKAGSSAFHCLLEKINLVGSCLSQIVQDKQIIERNLHEETFHTRVLKSKLKEFQEELLNH